MQQCFYLYHLWAATTVFDRKFSSLEKYKSNLIHRFMVRRRRTSVRVTLDLNRIVEIKVKNGKRINFRCIVVLVVDTR